MIEIDKKAQEIWQIYETYRSDTASWREERDRCEKFYFGNQWSGSVGGDLEDAGQTDIVVNKIRALNRMRVSMMIANKPTGQVFGVKKGDVNLATLLNEFADWHLYNSDWQYQLEKAVMGQNRVGIHWFTLFSDNLADYGRGELKVSNESYRYVFVDKAAGTTWDFSDAARIINTKQVRPEDWFNSIHPDILKRVGITEDDIAALLVPDDEIRWVGERQHRKQDDIGTPSSVTSLAKKVDAGDWLRELDIYEKVIVDVPVLLDAQGVFVQALDPDDDIKPEYKQLISEGALTEKVVPQRRIRYRKSLSGKIFLPLNSSDFKTEDILPIEYYPLIPVVNEDTGNSMPLGEIDFQSGIQEMLNMAYSLTLLNASLASNMKLIIDAAAAGESDLEGLRERWAIPGQIFNWKTHPQTGTFPYDLVKPEPLSQAWFTLIQAFSQELEFQISTYSFRTGDPSQAPETFSATLQLGQWAQDILRIPLSRLELALERIYNLLFSWAPHYYNFEKIFYTFGANGEALYRSINFSNFEFVKAHYRIRAGSTLPSQSVAELGILQTLAQQQPALIGSVIDRLPGLTEPDRKEIKQTIDLVSQLSQQNAQKEEVIKVLQTQLQHLSESNLALQKNKELQPIKEEVNRILNIMKDTRVAFEKANSRSPKTRRR